MVNTDRVEARLVSVTHLLGRTVARAAAPSAPISLSQRSKLISALLNTNVYKGGTKESNTVSIVRMYTKGISNKSAAACR